ncbi:hypothetical protein XH99_30495 [Bradyrhizobium nanningense]|uniref:Uncharacterized protein n=1 Tax=Bradyrhizobium nanningense TaxID=1325118 RepID=A0A4Q0RX09_9BRAD|nr:hypothetical protein XH99_30495 [Bradyrhizobium nanningense]RXH31274.1 hypothetical protein XH84_16185 [Bradyrhizobium nanningense]TQF33930.1 hypothetical protein UNPA324_33710 [Bradyrhizobium sp. UNPA324]
MVFLPHACLRQAARVDSRTCLTLEAITPESDANSTRMRRFPSAHKLAKSLAAPPRAVEPHARVASCDKPTQIAGLATLV